MSEKKTRIAIIDQDKCKPSKCNLECKRFCPINSGGAQCVEVSKSSVSSSIAEDLCTGCGICVKKCPFDAIKIINLPSEIASELVHQYGVNGFRLHRMPVPKKGSVLGLVGSNGLGKSTAIKILSGAQNMNFGVLAQTQTLNPPFKRNSKKSSSEKNNQSYLKRLPVELIDFFTRTENSEIKSSVKPQYVDTIPKFFKKIVKVKDILIEALVDSNSDHASNESFRLELSGVLYDEANNPTSNNLILNNSSDPLLNEYRQFFRKIVNDYNLSNLLERLFASEEGLTELSGGELQRISILVCGLKNANLYVFDEPSSFLDIRQRIDMAKFIDAVSKRCNNQESTKHTRIDFLSDSNLLNESDVYTILIEHDLSILDYLSNYISILYGDPGSYGVVSKPMTTKEGINIFLEGFLPSDNTRFRTYELKFKISENQDEFTKDHAVSFNYPSMKKSYQGFTMNVCGGYFNTSEVVVLLGENGTGKTTFIKLLAGKDTDDDKQFQDNHSVSYKPQYISPKFDGTVGTFLNKTIGAVYFDPLFQTEIVKPLGIPMFLNKELKNLSGGELQRVALTVCLGKEADIYLIDEPSAFLDSEQRLVVAKIIKRFVLQKRKSAFVVEHDFMMATYLADRVILFEGIPSVESKVSEPLSLVEGMNHFLKTIDVTFRKDGDNFRPRINKLNSMKDREQKASGNYFMSAS
jgi:ATP-binding cassette subfamily E protein 1